MSFDYSTKGEVSISMKDYVLDILNEAPSKMSGVAATPAMQNLFKVNNENGVPLNNKWKQLFHHIVMQLLYLSQRERPDIKPLWHFYQ